MTDIDLEAAYWDLEAAINDWATDHPQLVRYPGDVTERMASVIFEAVLGLERGVDNRWVIPE